MTRLLLVYNANAGLVASFLDSLQKVVSPTTYPCSLCAVTYGPLAMAPPWQAYLKAMPYPVTFYHRPDFRAAFPAYEAYPLPLIALYGKAKLDILLSAAELDALPDLDALMAALDVRLTPPPPAPPAHSFRALPSAC